MKALKHILVTLDLTDIDQTLIRYANTLVRYFQPARVTFLHVIQAYNLTEQSRRDFPDVETELNAIIIERINESVDTYFREDVNWVVDTEVGYEDAAEEVIRYAHANHIDLTLLGHKYGENREGRYGHKISSEIESDIMLVPEFGAEPLRKICCAIDFTEAAREAFERALDLTEKYHLDLVCHFLSNPSHTYFPVTSRGVSSQKKQQYHKTAQKFLNRYDLELSDINLHSAFDDQRESEARKSYQTAHEQEADLIMIGAEGKSTIETSFLGNLIRGYRLMELQIPVMFTKTSEKGLLDKIWPS